MPTSLYLPASEYNLRNFNKRTCLDLIRFTPGGISRADLARKMGLSRSALTLIVNDLIDQGLVIEGSDAHLSGGRKPILLEINPRRGFLAGVDIGATHLIVMLADFSARIIDEIEAPFDIRQAPEDSLKFVDSALQKLLAANHLDGSQLLAVGVGVPGPVMAEHGWVCTPPIMPGWDRFPIRARLENLWGCPVSLNNDAELGALGEWSHGAGRQERNLAFIKVGTGIGAGLMLDGQIYGGATGCAGEIGHMAVVDDGPLCTCGNQGCLESVAGGAAIAARARSAARNGKRTQLSQMGDIDQIHAVDVASAARRGDLVAQEIISEAGSYLGVAISSLVNLFNPGMVVVGGGVAQTGDLILEPVRRTVHQRSLRSTAQAVRITSSLLGRRSSGMGAVVKALNTALDKLTEYT